MQGGEQRSGKEERSKFKSPQSGHKRIKKVKGQETCAAHMYGKGGGSSGSGKEWSEDGHDDRRRSMRT